MGTFLGYIWFLIVIKVILKSENFLRKIFKKFGVINTLTDDHQSEQVYNKNAKLNEEFEALSKKQKSLGELKDKLKIFRENVEKMDFIKNVNHNDISKKAKSDFDTGLNEKIQQILDKDNANFDQNDLKNLNTYLTKIKKTE